MISIDRQMWQSIAVFGLSICLVGCGSKASNNTVQTVPAANSGGAAAPGAQNQMAAHAAMPNAVMPMPAQINTGAPAGGMSADQMAKMSGQQHAMQSSGPAGANPSPSSPEQMAKMMNQQHSMPSGGQPSVNPPAMTPEQMAKMAKMQSSDPNSANSNPNAANQQMADAMKKQGAMNAHGGASSAPNAAAIPANMNQGQQGAGSGQSGAAGATGPSFPSGSADEAVYKFCVAMAEGDTAAANEFVSAKSKGILAELHEGTLSEEKIEEVTNLLTPLTELSRNPEQTGSTKRALRNGKGQSISFTLKKEKDAYKITEFSYSKPKKKS